MKGVIKLRIFRFNPEKDRVPYFDTFEIPVEGPTSVLSLLKYVYEELDPTLAFPGGEHMCYKGVCGACVAIVNGKVEKTCMRLAYPGEEIIVEPLRGQPIVRDLVTDPGNQVATKDGVFLIKYGAIIERKTRKE